ncbi:hypothetical protein GCM10027073_24880 [Streptomyces chlorus]|uniref:HEPN domain-containing protein n=1 Tax=Streptomyces chlorus TaxID=887452 RepID=A0ABW1DQ15_9ACTN
MAKIRDVPETLQEDHFARAAKRHFDDAAYVHRDSRLPTADHLYGFAAECAVKSLLLRFTDVAMGPSNKPEVAHPEPPDDDPERTLQFGHINQLVREIKLLARGRSGAPLHAALDGDLRVFRGWHVSTRYSDGTYAQAEVVERRRDAARRILTLHEHALLHGKLT